MKLRTTRLITQEECPWINADIPIGTFLWDYCGRTYGVITANGRAVSAKLAETPFFEVPMDAVIEAVV